MAVNINIPSQVKTYANLAAFPASGSLKTIYIAEDTNKTYRWTGIVYVEISASAAMTWGQIGGTLSNQTDLQNALDAKVPTTRTLTINGTTQDLSANRTFNIPTDLTVGTTPISSGTIGRVLFEGTGNVLQESANLFWDNTNGRLGVGGTPGAFTLDVNGTARVSSTVGQTLIVQSSLDSSFTSIAEFNASALSTSRTGFVAIGRNGATNNQASLGFFYSGNGSNSNRLDFGFYGTNPRLSILAGGNILVGTTTDAGFRLDVNGTARVQTSLAVTTGKTFSAYQSGSIANDALKLTASTDGAVFGIQNSNALGFSGIEYLNAAGASQVFTGFNNNNNQEFRFNNFATGGFIDFRIGGTSSLRIFNSRNVGINTTTDIASSQFQIDSTTKGFLPPRMTTTQKNAIATPATGLQVYDTTLNQMSYYNGTTWTNI